MVKSDEYFKNFGKNYLKCWLMIILLLYDGRKFLSGRVGSADSPSGLANSH